jgi:hypothetical protein
MLCRLLAARARLRQISFKSKDAEVSPTRREIRIGNLYHSFKAHTVFYGLARQSAFSAQRRGASLESSTCFADPEAETHLPLFLLFCLSFPHRFVILSAAKNLLLPLPLSLPLLFCLSFP